MKVLHISGANAWGGNEQQLIYCIPELNSMGVENIVFGMNNSVLEKQCLLNDISFIKVKGSKLNKFSNFRYVKCLIDDIKPDLIHLHTSNSLTFYVLIDLFLKLKIKTVFSKKAISASSSFMSKFKYNYKGIDAVFCVSKSVQHDFSQTLSTNNKKKLVVIPDCVPVKIIDKKSKINLREKYNINKNCFVIGNIANHTSAKDLMTFINVADYMVNILKRNNVVFFQIGEFTKLTGDYLNIIEEKKLQKNIFFTDKIEDASSLNIQFDVFLMTSQREGGPTSVLEAMLVGVPIVTTNVGIIPEAITDGINGFVSPVKDSVNLASKISLLLDDENLRKSFVENSSLVIKDNFTASVIAKKTFNEYKRIINS
jgi:glycosyltransferase involved in cell wall biosynthesis